jgi:hypothetical protein
MKSRCFIFALAAVAAPLLAQTPAPAPPPSPSAPSLSQATLDRIAHMRPLFNGKNLAGWIQSPTAPLNFSAADITDAAALAKKISMRADAISTMLGGQLDEPGETALAAYSSEGEDPKVMKDATAALVRALNRMVSNPALYTEACLAGVKVRPDMDVQRRRDLQGQELLRSNRVLLEEAFPQEIAASPSSCWVVKDGVMASTGAGRGVIYTQRDFTNFRLIFTMRHVSAAKPTQEHQPCFLVFCTRPEPGERGLDALGGIQFQTPNGGHWDYRPGHNNAGTAFTNPRPRTKFDSHEWHQVEILVNAKDGTARMAVAQPVGTRAIENLDFKDPEAGKTGPIAWQMHNAGLFDEYKDVRIEVNPKEDQLITTEK